MATDQYYSFLEEVNRGIFAKIVLSIVMVAFYYILDTRVPMLIRLKSA
ncbi:hypothetical protein DFA_10280 [Cavenderia fasciculata]|uniref:Uncharacterized protein n=1 Tax=Cavenderia fasciculata TaxID=261658 RepID=F4Q9S4_CACFS|nr:uncharacterized protein DFA_10280 [Cavenderia fasciculata]EGG15443.1 hypothetical protein DFA_10280 [Cavenderia fasciculata]|eukprot:XP_004354185.1 hypothetical protein DFA_10280 [Cavenderia fasciculata]